VIPLKFVIYVRDSRSEYSSRERKCLATSLIGTNKNTRKLRDSKE